MKESLTSAVIDGDKQNARDLAELEKIGISAGVEGGFRSPRVGQSGGAAGGNYLGRGDESGDTGAGNDRNVVSVNYRKIGDTKSIRLKSIEVDATRGLYRLKGKN